MKVAHYLLLQVQSLVRADLPVLDDVGQLDVGGHHGERQVPDLLPPPLDDGGDVEPHQEGDDLGHVLHQQTPSFEPMRGRRSALFKIIRIGRGGSCSAVPILWCTHPVSLVEALDGEVDHEVEEEDQAVPYQDVPPPLTVW